ncbi:MAG: metal ABC transporter substrate-binding protein [Zoogloeaceae bacterium]|nr:metal ABC transporter substrate-binding protein [Zoogloeaceae bacterium]
MASLLRTFIAVCALVILPSAALAGPLEVVASFSILGDLVRQVGGARIRVTVLVGPGEDAHGYQPRPSDARRVRGAGLVLANGLGFDPWMERLARSAGYRGPVILASRGIVPMTHAASDRDDHGHETDPHAWQDVSLAIRYVATLADALAAADPEGATDYRTRAQHYAAELTALDGEIRRTLGALPPDRRLVVTSHDAFGYFARAYGVRFLAPVGLSSNAEPTAAGVASLIRQVRETRAPAVFLENISDPRLLERIRRESGARVGGTLYSDALAEQPPADTYLGMMRENLRVLSAALAP